MWPEYLYDLMNTYAGRLKRLYARKPVPASSPAQPSAMVTHYTFADAHVSVEEAVDGVIEKGKGMWRKPIALVVRRQLHP